MVKRFRKNDRGIALLAVILGIALMTLVVVDFATSSEFGFMSAANQANELRSYYLARSGVSIGLAILAADARNKALGLAPNVETLSDPWAAPYPPTSVGGGQVSLSIVDEDRKLDLNSMITYPPNGTATPNQGAMLRVQRLFGLLGLDPDLVNAIVEWIAPAGLDIPGVSSIGSEFYMGLKPPYQPRNGPMPTIGDLMLVRGFNQEIFNRLQPFVTVFASSGLGPNGPPVNVNTAPPEVLASLEPELSEDPDLVKQLVLARTVAPFLNVTDVTNNVPALGPISARLTQDVIVKSQYFTITGVGSFAGSRKIIDATFLREQTGQGDLAAWRER